jgi:hypothetical protein
VLKDGVGGDGRAVADLLDRIAARPVSANSSLRPSTIARGVVLDAGGDLLGVMVPSAPSSTMSVKVPPISTPTR